MKLFEGAVFIDFYTRMLQLTVNHGVENWLGPVRVIGRLPSEAPLSTPQLALRFFGHAKQNESRSKLNNKTY